MRRLWLFLLIMMLPTGVSITFTEPAVIDGELIALGESKLFIIAPSGAEIDIWGAPEAFYEEHQFFSSPAGHDFLPASKASVNIRGGDQGLGRPGASASLHGIWTISGTSTAEIWSSASHCSFDDFSFRESPCLSIGEVWAELQLENATIAGTSASSTLFDFSWTIQPESGKNSRSGNSPYGSIEAGSLNLNKLETDHSFYISAQQLRVLVSISEFTVGGSIELPNYNDESKSAPNLVAEGTFQFRNMTFKDGRFDADMSGEADAARLDNEIVSSESLGLAAVSVAGSAAISILIWKTLSGTLVAGFTRMSMEDALEHPKRQKVYGYILGHPGATFREVVRETGYATGTTRHHLTILKRSNAIMEQKYLQTLRYFENHGRYNETWDTIALLREEPLAVLHQWVMDNPMNNQKAILAAMAEVGWSRSTAQHRLSRLVDGGLVSMRPQGRMNMYEASSKVLR